MHIVNTYTDLAEFHKFKVYYQIAELNDLLSHDLTMLMVPQDTTKT